MNQGPKHKGNDVFPGPWSFSACWQWARKRGLLWAWDRETNRAFEVLSCIWYTLVFFSPKEIKKMSFGCRNTGSIPSNELLITGKKGQGRFNIKADHKGSKEVPPEEWGTKQCYDKEKVCLVQVESRAYVCDEWEVRTGRNAPHPQLLLVLWWPLQSKRSLRHDEHRENPLLTCPGVAGIMPEWTLEVFEDLHMVLMNIVWEPLF